MNVREGTYYVGLTGKYETLGEAVSKKTFDFLPVKMNREVILSLFLIWIQFVRKQGCAWVSTALKTLFRTGEGAENSLS